ncbi:hypothetical protein PSTT_15719 [Puccinia striiformis]|nr:hypothetical protein PSTT_15719 [Puccinia striiformis]
MLAKQAAHKLMLKESKSQKRKSANNKDSKPDEESEPEEINPEDWDNVAFHMQNILEKYKLIKTDYDQYRLSLFEDQRKLHFRGSILSAAKTSAKPLIMTSLVHY